MLIFWGWILYIVIVILGVNGFVGFMLGYGVGYGVGMGGWF